MFNLVAKDILIQKKQLLFGFVYILFLIFAFQSMGSAASSGGVVAFTYMLVMTSCAYEDKNKTDIMLNSLPVRRSHIVAAKYISVYVFLTMGMIFYYLSTTAIGILGLPVKAYPLTLESFVGGVVAVSLLSGIYLPIFFKVGYLRSKIFNFILFFLFFFGVQYFVAALQESKNHAWINGISDFFQSQGDIIIALTIFAIAMILLITSYAVSLKFYKQREF